MLYFQFQITTLEQLPCLSRVAQDRNGKMRVQTVPNSTFAPPPSLSFLPSSQHSSHLKMLKHQPGILLSPFQLFPRFSQRSVSTRITAAMRAYLKPHCVVNHVHLLQGRKEEARGGPAFSELNYVQVLQNNSFNGACGSCLGSGISS